jgi:hypothetical protein
MNKKNNLKKDGDPGSNSQNYMISCLLTGMGKNSHREVNYSRIKEITQNPDENPTLFINHLMESMTKYTNLNPASQECHIF